MTMSSESSRSVTRADQQSSTRKVILAGPEIPSDVIAANLAAVAVGTLKLLLWAMVVAIGVFGAIMIGFVRASRKR